MKIVTKQVTAIIIGLVLASPGFSGQKPVGSKPPARTGHSVPPVQTVIHQYFDLLSSSNFDIAGDMWTPEALERSGRFDINYQNAPLRVDCSSPATRYLEHTQTRLVVPIKRYEDLGDGAWYRMEYSDLIGSQIMTHNYFGQRRGDWYWLTYAQDFYAADWPVRESKYFRIHASPEVAAYLNPAVLAMADQYVERMADTLGMSSSKIEQIAASRIEYFYCASDSLVQQLTGHRVKGVLDLPSNDIISSVFPNNHELMHLLINIRLGNLPMCTQPVLQKGLAVSLGGRWGKHPSTLLDLGAYLYREELVPLAGLLSVAGFGAESGADIVYPVAGLFSAYFTDKLGIKKSLELYLALSGECDEIDQMAEAEVEATLLEATGLDTWVDLVDDFERFIDQRLADQVAALPGFERPGTLVAEGDGYVVRQSRDWAMFEFSTGASADPPQGNLIFGIDDSLVGERSALYEAQYGPAAAYDGYRYSVRYDQYEAGLYDYATNQLLAKYIWGISPSEEYFDATENKITIRFKKSLISEPSLEAHDFQRLPE